jgi:cyclophilin family peptidyl-prolyl cis-trans isomerase
MVRTTIKSKKKGQPLAASKDASRDVLPRTGMGAGATMVDSASKLMASYGKVLVPVLFLIVAGFAAYLIWSQRTSSSEQEFKNRVDRASMANEKVAELKSGMETLIAEAEGDPAREAYAWYRYATRTYQVLERPYKAEQLQEAIGILNSGAESLSQHEEHASWHRHVAGLLARLKADQEFLANPDNKKLLPWDHNSKPDKPQPRLVDGKAVDASPENKNPIVVFVTEYGLLRVMLYEDQAENAVWHMVSLCDEGYYDRTTGSTLAFSNTFNPTGPYKGSTIISAGKQGRPVGVELEKPTTAKEEDDVDTVAENNPYSITYQGNDLARFQRGSFALARDPDDPSRARAEFFVVIEPSEALGLNFKPLGEVLDGEDGMKIARRLHQAEIYYTYVEQKRQGVDYVPQVYYDGWPVPRKKVQKLPQAVRFDGVKTEVIPAAAEKQPRPVVVIQLEKGDMVIELFEDICPNTVANFINLIEENFYNTECKFYRVLGTGTDIAEIHKNTGERIAQGGFSGGESREGYNYVIRNEANDNERYKQAGLRNTRGTIAMARTNTGLDTASTEFFINIKDHPHWDEEESPYCVFGEVIFGLEFAAALPEVDPNKGGTPTDAHKIKGAKVLRKRAHEYVPEVKYNDGGDWVKKKPVELPKSAPEDEKEDEKE